MLTETELFAVGNFDASSIAHLRAALGGGVDAISVAGALDPASYISELAISGTVAFSLAAPTVAGQRKRIVCVSAAATPVGTLTIASPDNVAGFVCAGTFVFNSPGQAIELVATAALRWRCVRVQRAGTQTVVVGTTVLTGLNLAATYALSVTGTVSSTATRALPDGSAVGETVTVGCSVAASTPSGTIALSALTTLGAAGTTLGTFNATTCYAALMWNGTAWQLIGNTTVVLS